MWQYYLATGDAAWLARDGYPVIQATADFWVDRAERDAKTGRYDIRGVVSVDEDLIGVDNEAYTNAVARLNLELAAKASEIVGREPDPRWAEVASALALPYDADEDFYPTYEDAPADAHGAVAPLLAYPLGLAMSERTKRNDLAHAVRRMGTHRMGPMMTVTLYALVAAELGDRALVDELGPLSYRPNLRGPFLALAETPHNDAVHFLTGAGGFLQQVIFGYTGLRIGEGGLVHAYPPVLPSRVRRLVLRNVKVRGKRYDVVTESGATRMHPAGDD
jgi:trehalose/maltose hydrolase-like predicted phosphorylase